MQSEAMHNVSAHQLLQYYQLVFTNGLEDRGSILGQVIP